MRAALRPMTLAVAIALSFAATACASQAGAPSVPPPVAPNTCATGDQLYDVLTANAKIWINLGKPTALNDPVCAGDYALARATDSTTGGDPARVLFKKSAAGKWTVVTGGTAGVCNGLPADVTAKLRGC